MTFLPVVASALTVLSMGLSEVSAAGFSSEFAALSVPVPLSCNSLVFSAFSVVVTSELVLNICSFSLSFSVEGASNIVSTASFSCALLSFSSSFACSTAAMCSSTVVGVSAISATFSSVASSVVVCCSVSSTVAFSSDAGSFGSSRLALCSAITFGFSNSLPMYCL